MKKYTALLQGAIVFGFIFLFLFYRLGNLPFRVWDETRLITSAYEMAHNGQWLVPEVDQAPDMWNTKPPLMIWSQAVLIKSFGLNEWTARLPAAICATVTVLAIGFFVFVLTQSGWAALIAVSALCTAGGFVGMHGVRFGEYDSMLAMFTSLYLLCFFLYTEKYKGRTNTFILLFFVFLTGAALTKGVAAMLFTPALALYLLLRKQLAETLTNKYTYLGLAVFLLAVGGYYLLRERYNPGYLQAVWENELIGRYTTDFDAAYKTKPHYYLSNMRHQFKFWLWALIATTALVWLYSRPLHKRAVAFCFLTAGFFVLVISYAETRMLWYNLPVFPLLAIVVAITLYFLAGIAAKFIPVAKEGLLALLFVALSVYPVIKVYSYLRWQTDDLQADNFYAPSYYFIEALEGKRDLNNTTYATAGYNVQWRLYVKMLSDKGVNLRDLPWDGFDFNPGDKVIANQQEVKDIIESRYNVQVYEEYYGLKNYIILDRKR